ncbi:hypothetical protein F441_11881, partial [Phytophthora nicotianae CJ01A1]
PDSALTSTSCWSTRSMRLLLPVLAVAVTLVAARSDSAVTVNEISKTASTKSTVIHNAVPGLHVATRELSGDDATFEERRGGGGHGGGHGGGGGGGGGGHGGHGVSGGGEGGHGVSGGDGGGYATTTGDGGGDTPIGGGRVHPAGANSNTGSMNTNGVADQKEEKCDRFVNWFKRLFDKSIKKCPKEVEEDMRRLRT